MKRVLHHGVALIEILVAVAIVGIAVFSLYELIVLSRATTSRELRRTQAVSLAQEGLEAVRVIRDNSWTENIAPLSTSTTYYASLSGTSWTLTSANPGLIDSLFARTVTFENVNRDASDNISVSGSVDPDTRKVTSTVSWTERGASRAVVLATYITNFQDN